MNIKNEIQTIVLPNDPAGMDYIKLKKSFSDATASSKRLIFLDCSNIDSFYSQIQAMLALFGRRMMDEGKEIILVNMNKRLYKQLEVSGLNRMIRAFPLESEAIVVLEKIFDRHDDFAVELQEPKEEMQELVLKGTSADIKAKEKLKECFDKIDWQKIKRFQINMKEVEFIDSFGIGMLGSLKTMAKKNNCILQIKNPNEMIRDMLNLSNLGELLPVEPPLKME
jgi:anti-anti-sigma factor